MQNFGRTKNYKHFSCIVVYVPK